VFGDQAALFFGDLGPGEKLEVFAGGWVDRGFDRQQALGVLGAEGLVL